MRYIQLLLQPLADELDTFSRIDQSALGKRKRDLIDSSILLNRPYKATEPSRSREGTHICALVDVIVCPKAISELKLISESIRKYGRYNKIQVAMDVYTNAESSIYRSRRLKIFAAIYICVRFDL